MKFPTLLVLCMTPAISPLFAAAQSFDTTESFALAERSYDDSEIYAALARRTLNHVRSLAETHAALVERALTYHENYQLERRILGIKKKEPTPDFLDIAKGDLQKYKAKANELRNDKYATEADKEKVRKNIQKTEQWIEELKKKL